jgi:hypothetical protein
MTRHLKSACLLRALATLVTYTGTLYAQDGSRPAEAAQPTKSPEPGKPPESPKPSIAASSTSVASREESPAMRERHGLLEQDALEETRARVTASAAERKERAEQDDAERKERSARNSVERKEKYELRRAQHLREMERLQGQPDESNARKLLDRRVFMPKLLSYGFGFGGVGLGSVDGFGGSLPSFGATENSSAFMIRPQFDVRVNGQLTFGGTLSLHHFTLSSAGGSGTLASQSLTQLAVAPRLGYLTALGQSGLLLWPKATLSASYGASRSRSTGPAGNVANARVCRHHAGRWGKPDLAKRRLAIACF